MPETILASFPLLPDGNLVLTPALLDNGHRDYDITLEGCFHCAVNNRDYDALYVCGEDGAAETSLPHALLDWTPARPLLIQANPAAHRYVFRVPKGDSNKSVGIRINTDRFVNDFIISPSEARNALSGQIALTVSVTPIAPPSLWPAIGLAALPAMLLAGGTGWILKRRMVLGGLDYDLQIQLGSIEQKVRAACSAVRREDARLVPVRKRLTVIQDEACKLARQVQQLRRAQAAQNRPALERDLLQLHRRAEELTEAAEREAQETRNAKLKTLALLNEMREAETHGSLRLAKLEAVLDSTVLSLQSLRLGEGETTAEESVCRALDAEVSALREAVQQQAVGH